MIFKRERNKKEREKFLNVSPSPRNFGDGFGRLILAFDVCSWLVLCCSLFANFCVCIYIVYPAGCGVSFRADLPKYPLLKKFICILECALQMRRKAICEKSCKNLQKICFKVLHEFKKLFLPLLPEVHGLRTYPRHRIQTLTFIHHEKARL